MHTNFTTEELMVLKIYGETSEKESHELNNLLNTDYSFKKEYDDFNEIGLSISGLLLEPDQKIIKNILNYSLNLRQN